MAIILGDGSRPSLEAVVLHELRPVVDTRTLAEGSPPGSGIWSDQISAARESLVRAARAVGRIVPGETQLADRMPYVGTAFVVAPRLAVTAAYGGDLLRMRNRRPGSTEGEPLGWLDLDDVPGTGAPRFAITSVHRVHPYWRFIFLALDQEVGADSILRIANAESVKELAYREICVIGFPAYDGTRNDPAIIRSLFGDRFGIKRLMPGHIVGMEDSPSRQFTPMILHDASTLAGTGGAPLIDLASGLALGINFSGRFGEANQAVPAWELDRDPQWEWLWAGTPRGEAPRAPDVNARAAVPTVVFPTQRLVALQNLLVANGISAKTDVLLNGLPAGLSAELRNFEAPSSQDRLYVALASLNRSLYLLEGEGTLPLETVLLAAEALSFNLQRTKALKSFIDEAGHIRSTIAARGG